MYWLQGNQKMMIQKYDCTKLCKVTSGFDATSLHSYCGRQNISLEKENQGYLVMKKKQKSI